MSINGVFRSALKYVIDDGGKRSLAIMLLTIFVVPILLDPVTTIAMDDGRVGDSSDVTTKKQAPALKTVEATEKPAADVSFGAKAGAVLGVQPLKATGDTLAGPNQPASNAQTSRDLIEMRTPTSDTRINADGTFSRREYVVPQYFKSGNTWKNIDTKLIEDTNAGDSRNVFGQVLGKAQSLYKEETTFTIKDNNWKARFAPSNSSVSLVRINDGKDEVGFSPVKANNVAPKVVTDKSGEQSVWYYSLWSGVDVQYIVTPTGIKENIIIKNKQSTSSFSFTVKGGALKKIVDTKTNQAFYRITGILNDEFAFAPFFISLNNYGLEANQPITQKFQNNSFTVSIDKTYLKNLPGDAYPVTLDPTIDSYFGNRASGSYRSFKSDGYVCGSTVCNPMAGSVADSSGQWREWRGSIQSPYQFLQGRKLIDANLHLTQRTGISTSGSMDWRYFHVAHNTCYNFHCTGEVASPGWVPILHVGDINVTNIYRSRIAAGDWEAWLMILGENDARHTYKNWDPQHSFVTFRYAEQVPKPSIISPVNNQVFIDPQVSLRTSTHGNPNSGTPLQYEFCVSINAGCDGGTIVRSGKIAASQWTVPDGVLQDGNTYYAQSKAIDPDGGGGEGDWSNAQQFKIDMRRGKDKTQTFDTVGPVDIDLATGNLSTSNASHSSSALGGSLGVSVDYNSPMRSRNGLVGQYFNNQDMSGAPAYTRVDPTVDFAWNDGSPNPVINNDNFSARWSGYFVAPKAGEYFFGSRGDDGTRITINGSKVQENWQPGAFPVLYGAAVSLKAGEVATIAAEYYEVTGGAYNQLYVKGAVDEQVVPKEWLQTGVRAVDQQTGLTGRYYNYRDDKNLDSNEKTLFMTRNDPILSMDWGGNAPVQGGAADFMVRWTGYINIPVSGSYQFGTNADDGSRIKIDGTTVMDNWTGPCCSLLYGNSVQLGAGYHSITVDMYDYTGGAKMFLYAKGAVVEQVVPSSWLSTRADVLPNGWNLGIDPDGELSYDRLTANTNNVILSDSTGDTHEYTWTGSGYKPPVNEDGYLVRAADGSYTLNDTDGKTYVFNNAGVLVSVTMPVDDRRPAALSYSYTGSPAKISQISDGVDANRNAKVYYSGDTQCGSTPAGFDTNPPTGMLCAVITNDGRATYFYYVGGNLARILKPGNEATDYQYDTLGRIVAVRDSVANDAIVAGKRKNDATVLTTITYDELGRAQKVTAPAPTASGTRQQETLEYLPADVGYTGATLQHVIGDSEPNGYSRRVEYDNLFRTTKDIDITKKSTAQTWDQFKDLLYSTTDAAGFMSTTVYDTDDRPIEQYGPAPSSWFGTDRRPLSQYAAKVPKTTTAFDEGMTGVAVAWHKVSTTTGSLTGAPVAHSTGISPNDATWLGRDFRSNPLPANYGLGSDYGFSATGKITFPSSGMYTFTAQHDDGVRLWIDDQSLFSTWENRTEGAASTTPVGYFNAEAGKLYRFRYDYAHFGTAGSQELSINGPGITDVNNGRGTSRPTFIKPGYSLETSSTVHDAKLGNITSTTNYGATPELGLVESTVLDSTGIALKSTSNYEFANTSGSYLRQLSTTLPGGTTTTYAYYGATEVVDNPCTTNVVEAFRQGGQLRLKTDPDPDGAGTKVGRATETIYDDSGAIVATRYNAEPWTCNTYDVRGRTVSAVIPAYNGSGARTVSNNYAVGGNPLVTSTTDSAGTMTVETDLLGRVTSYTDVNGNTTTSTYDGKGRLTKRVSKNGTETYGYDSYDRLTVQKHDGIGVASIAYDTYSRISSVTYPNGLKLSAMGRDELGRVNSLTYTLASGEKLTDKVVRATTGDILSGTELGQAKNYTYDRAGRLTAATIAGNNFSYSFDAQASTCGTTTNPNAGKNGNRMSQTVNGKTTTYCYDYADRLVKSSDAALTGATYDTHGNVKSLGSSPKTSFTYDSSDRLTKMVQSNGPTVWYGRDSQGRIIKRTETINGKTMTSLYGYTAAGDTPDFITDTAGKLTEQYLTLPGNVLLTVRPDRQSAGVQTWSLPNIHGDIFATTNADGGLVSKTLTGPFGEPLTNQLVPNNMTGSASYSYVGQHQKQTEAAFVLQPIDMGARTYIPTLGRFLQMDPVKGGTPNDYAYATDPVNDFDLDGRFGWKKFASIASVGSMIPGPIGMASAAVSAAAYAKAGDRKNAAMMAGAVALAAVGAGGAVVAMKSAKVAKSFSGGVKSAYKNRTRLDESGHIRLPRKSVNQINRDIQSGRAPRTIIRADRGKIYKEQDHIHFRGGHALNRDRTWKHGKKKLTNAEKRYLKNVGW